MSKKIDLNLLKEQLQFYTLVKEETKILKGWSEEEYQEEIRKLEERIELSERGTRSRRKGATFERKVAKSFKDKFGINLVRTPLSGGFQKDSAGAVYKGDLTNLDESIDFKLQIECKNQKTWKLKQWYNQVEEEAKGLNTIPTVIFHEHGGRDFIMMQLDDFLNVVDSDKIIQKKEQTTKRKVRRTR